MADEIDAFRRFAESNYVAASIHHPPFQEEERFASAFNQFMRLAPDERIEIGSKIDFLIAHYLWVFAIRSASFATQTGNERYLSSGMVVLLIDSKESDPRDVVGALSVLNDASIRLGVDFFSSVVQPVLGVASASRRKLIEDFFFHPDSIREPSRLGFQLVRENGVPWYHK